MLIVGLFFFAGTQKSSAKELTNPQVLEYNKDTKQLEELKTKTEKLKNEILELKGFISNSDCEVFAKYLEKDNPTLAMSPKIAESRYKHEIEDLEGIQGRAKEAKQAWEEEQAAKALAAQAAMQKQSTNTSTGQKKTGGAKESYSGSGVNFKSAGVIYQGGRRFTYYSSRVLHHYRTKEWTAGSDGIYRTKDGYVVVAASDKPQGSIVDTPFGSGKVLDSGCQAGTTDIYTNY